MQIGIENFQLHFGFIFAGGVYIVNKFCSRHLKAIFLVFVSFTFSLSLGKSKFISALPSLRIIFFTPNNPIGKGIVLILLGRKHISILIRFLVLILISINILIVAIHILSFAFGIGPTMSGVTVMVVVRHLYHYYKQISIN